jgi:hypothetical protein
MNEDAPLLSSPGEPGLDIPDHRSRFWLASTARARLSNILLKVEWSVQLYR